jgi:hypothetical protein
MLNYTEAKIQVEGKWTGQDVPYDKHNIEIVNGVPKPTNSDMKRRFSSAIALEGEPDDFISFENVKRVDKILGEDDFDKLFPLRNKNTYTYEGLLKAVGKFPAFCDESNLSGYGKDLDKTCKRELATLFAHMT